MKNFELIDISTEKPSHNWNGFVITVSNNIEYKRIATYHKDHDMWVDGDFHSDETVVYWLKEIKKS